MMSLVLILKCLWGIYQQVFMPYTAQGLLEYINRHVLPSGIQYTFG